MTAQMDVNPFQPDQGEDERDRELVEEARAGSSEALEELVRRHQGFLHNLALRMLYGPQDAEDATQEILVKAITKLSSFEGRSRFRTWLYRIATNHLLNMQRTRREGHITFASFAKGLDDAPEEELPDQAQVPVDVKLLVEEARLGCTMAMLLCLDREQRLVYVLGEILGASDAIGAEVMDVGRDAFRQKLSRARRDLHGFMNEKCGLVNAANPCRCEKKTRAFMRAGYVDPGNLLFARERVRQVKEVAVRTNPALPGYDGLCADIYREHPFQEARDVAARVRQLVESPEFRETFRV
jgi:RNA polymerase sigma factor (sigma-70 family)